MHRSIHLFALLWLALACAAAGCGSTVSFTPTGNSHLSRAPRPASEVEVFSAGPPQRPYAELGIIESQQDESYASSPDAPPALLQEMRETAGAQGCDGLVLTGSNDAVVSEEAEDGSNTVKTLKGYRGTCIVFTDTPPEAAQEGEARTERLCIPNQTQICHGPGACHGGQSCLPDGSGYTECDCGPQPAPRPPGDGAHP